jgi:multiple antibiotic resistance protein
MIAGPAVLTTLITLARTHGYALTVTAYVLNLVIVWAALRWASLVGRLLGEAGGRAMTKVFSLVLAAIAVTFIRRGVMSALTR